MLNNYYLEISQGYGRKRKTVRVFDWLNEQSSYDSSGISNVFKPFGSNEFAWEDGSTNTQSSTQFTTTGPNDGNPGGGNPGGGNKPTRRKRKPPKDCGGSTNDGQIE